MIFVVENEINDILRVKLFISNTLNAESFQEMTIMCCLVALF